MKKLVYLLYKFEQMEGWISTIILSIAIVVIIYACMYIAGGRV